MANDATSRLTKGTIVYMVGNLTSKVLQMLILPLITASLLTSEYGYYDLVVTTIGLVTPLATLQICEGMFRYMFDASETEKKKNVSTTICFLIFSAFVLAVSLFIVGFLFPAVKYPFLIYLNYIGEIAFTFAQRLLRSQGKNRQFAIAGVINTIVMLAIQAVSLLVLNMKIDGMLLANCISYLVAAIYMVICAGIKQNVDIKMADTNTLKILLKYSIPLTPNSMAWSLVASSDRYVITYFLTTSMNGVYSIASRFSQLLTFFVTVFQMAWQESAIMEKNKDGRDEFYTTTFNAYMKLLLSGYIVSLPFIKIAIPLLLSDSYQKGYAYIPVLLMGAVLSAFSQFYGSSYHVFKKTGGAFATTMVAVIINISIGVGLIKYIGLFAPALGTMISFGVQWILRAIQMREYFHVIIDKRSLIILMLTAIAFTVMYYWNDMMLQVVLFVLGMVFAIVMNKALVRLLINKILRR